ncbi:MAG: hypothetical protein H6815_04975 [Phycisphaeraceae bacterium]|nr:hypothetical protein [Phycisphaerales bacterium]MCB9859788.1 hypothetical protein [Phycisphaeraceae bacterium]
MKLTHTLPLALAIGCVLCSAPALAQSTDAPAPQASARDDLPTATSIIEKSMETVGGQEQIHDIQSMHTKVSTSLMGTDVSAEMLWRRKGGRKTIMTMSNQGAFTRGSDGTIWWRHDQLGYALVEDDNSRQAQDREAELLMTVLDPITVAKEKQRTLRTIDRTLFEDHKCFVVETVIGDHESMHMFYDTESFLLIGMNVIQGDRTAKILFKDWKDVDGIRIFHTMEVSDPGLPEPIVYTTTEITLNSLNESSFATPEGVKKLMENYEPKPRDDDGR